jgi:hypothetical protein
VVLNPENIDQRTVGRLTYFGGLSLTSDAAEFGGLSALLVDEDGAAFTTVTDRGHWMRARLEYYDDGRLRDVAGPRLGPLRGTDGKPVAGTPWSDAESLVSIAGAPAVAFERIHRIWIYPKGPFGLAGVPDLRQVPMGPGYRYPYEHPNGGLEAVTDLKDGRLLAVTELFTRGKDQVRGWVEAAPGRDWRPLYYKLDGLFRPTGATTLPSGDVLVVERQYHRLGVPAGRIVRHRMETIRENAELSGEELAVLSPPLIIDNFEGIAARSDGRGGAYVYLLSDDNFSFLQRTLLLMFHLPAE